MFNYKKKKEYKQRTTSSYINFCKIKREELKEIRKAKNEPVLSLGAMQKELSLLWNNLSTEEKDSYKSDPV